MNNIPKVVFQTWKTKILHPNIMKIIEGMKLNNPNYNFQLHDDDDMNNFIKKEFPHAIYSAFSLLNEGAARADLWRYCILYKKGGIYLDIDSVINGNIDELIKKDDDCIITREKNRPYFSNWFLISVAGHPFLKLTIEKTVSNILNFSSKDIAFLTGPAGPFSDSLQKFFNISNNLSYDLFDIYDMSDENLNLNYKKDNKIFKLRVCGYDMNHFGTFKHQYVDDIYRYNLHWRYNAPLVKEAYKNYLLYFFKRIKYNSMVILIKTKNNKYLNNIYCFFKAIEKYVKLFFASKTK